MLHTSLDAPSSCMTYTAPHLLWRLGACAHRRRGRILSVWIFVILALGGVVATFGGAYSTQYTLPDVESANGFALLEERFGSEEGGRVGTIVLRVENGFTPEVVATFDAYFDELDRMDAYQVAGPFSERGAVQISRDGRTAFASVTLDSSLTSAEAFAEAYEEIRALAPVIPGVQVEYGGEVFAAFEAPTSEALGLAFAIVILILAFGSVLAMGLPIGTAFGGIGAGVLLGTLASHAVSMPDVSTTLGVMIGLGVGIDYALFIVTRYREARRRGSNGVEATAEAIDTAGRAVIFAGGTVVISLMGMLIMGVSFMNGLAIGATITVACTMIASVTLLPALLGFFGERIETTKWRGILAAGLVAVALVGYGLGKPLLYWAVPLAGATLAVGGLFPLLAKPLARRREKSVEETLPYRWSRTIQRRPWTAMIVGGSVLVAIALPVLDLRLGFADEGNYPKESTTRRAYDLLAEGFGPGFNGPLVLVAALDTPQAAKEAADVSARIAEVEGIVYSTEALYNDPAEPTAVRWIAYPSSAPQDSESADLVTRLREETLAGTEGRLDVLVTGSVAANLDFSAYLAQRLALFFAAVLTLSFLLLMLVFRSVLVPLKAVLMNLLSIGSAYGAVVAVFQWGWGSSLIGLGGGAPIDPWLPVMMFAIVFGLSMDYEVFLLSRVKEEYDRTGVNETAVADGVASTARVITAAAMIMVFVFGSFMLEANRSIKMFGFGLAVAVLLDATVVRLVLVPATMQLLGARNWWLPNWLRRVLPEIRVE